MARLIRSISAAAATVAVGATFFIAAGGPAGAGTMALSGFAGGTRVVGPGGVIISDTTAFSSVYTDGPDRSRSNKLASVTALNGLVKTGAITTSEAATTIPGGRQLVAHAETAKVTLLNSITIDAVDTTVTVKVVNGIVTTSSKTTFVGLSIPGQHVPATVPQNFHVTIPGLANLVLNTVQVIHSNGTTTVNGTGLFLSLLRPTGGANKGVLIFLNPSQASYGPAQDVSLPSPGGYAYGTQVTATTGSTNIADVESGPTDEIKYASSTNGQTVSHKVVGINTGSLASTGTIVTSVNGDKTASGARSTVGTSLTSANLLTGLVKADAIKGSVTSTLTHGVSTLTSTATLLNVVLAGIKLPLNPAPNTQLQIANLGTVTLDKIVENSTQIDQTLIDIVVTTKAYGLPVGAHVIIGRSIAWVAI